VGEKTAAALVRAFGSLDGIRHALDMGHGGFPKGAREKLMKARDYLDISMSVVRVVDTVPLPPVPGALPVTINDAVMMKDLGNRWGLGSSLGRFISAIGG
jgi:5'-3' exonuclease